MPEQLPTKSQLNKAGKALRKWALGELTDEVEYRAALECPLGYRAAHKDPLTKANMGLRSMVRTEGCRADVTQRLKRVPTIIDKLRREPTMQLSTMQDIGGCRAVLASIDEVRRVQKRLAKNRPPVRTSDYIEKARSTGYRGVHVVVCYDDRNIEVQLRTTLMHEWAITIEKLTSRLQEDLKAGEGPAEVQELMITISKAMGVEEAGGVVDNETGARIRELRRRAIPWLTGGGRG